ncbi:hypothetical protein C7C45_03730 [Micromonospora arborensis]|uniref:Uncharacterized protein n=1 Tax=Micromonospora arborensis TaxID=2116518 RepID=A0A318NNX0_9ACTN|nr:hypothetical protein C7C45_03730 [Micromonospora arborensis]
MRSPTPDPTKRPRVSDSAHFCRSSACRSCRLFGGERGAAPVEITPIGTVRNDRTDVQHSDNCGAVRSTITVDERFGDACLQGQPLMSEYFQP